ncbi:MAG: hypothetical protein ACOX4M_02550 [Acetivibrionales bacterium]
MSKKFIGGIFDNCAILFFIILFLLLFVDRGCFARDADVIE